MLAALVFKILRYTECLHRAVLYIVFYMCQDLQKCAEFHLVRKLTLKIYFGRRISLKQDILVLQTDLARSVAKLRLRTNNWLTRP